MKKEKFEVMPQGWYKRRILTEKAPTVTNVEVQGFQKIDNSYCTMVAEFDDGNVYTLDARINVNDINGRWTALGLNPHGISVLVKLLE